MLVSLKWLQQYVNVDADPQEIAHALTMAGLEVEGVHDRFAHLQKVVVGEILSAEPVKKSDHLQVCQVNAGGQTLQVVCGAPNARAGLKAPLALQGAEFPDGMVISKGKLMGQVSEGMLCSAKELEIGANAGGIMELDDSLTPGQNLAEALILSDTIFELGITPNRSDCLSMIGVARELAAIYGVEMTLPDASLPEEGGAVEDVTAVEILAPDHCPRYAARVIKGIKIGPSPDWLAQALLAIGIRPISNIVDVTNYVMMETGQPLHAFDYDLLEEGRIVVRLAAKGEKFTTLDSKENELEDDMLMICDGKKAVALAGVMGGLNSEINDGTTNVLIESAHFSPMSVRKTAKRLGYHTEASHRFERGTDHEGVLFAAQRAAQLMLQTAGGVCAKGAVDAHPVTVEKTEITLSASRTNEILGTDIPFGQIVKYLESVNMEVTPIDQDAMKVLAPVYRVDVSRPEDLMEEVARLFGYDNIPTTWPAATMEIHPSDPIRDFGLKLRTSLGGQGFREAINYSFVGADTPQRLMLAESDKRTRTLPILNPLTEDQAVMRTSLLPGLFASVAVNINYQNKDLALFEIGKTFIAEKGRELPTEIECLCLVLSGAATAPSWQGKAVRTDFFEMKGCCEALMADFHIENAEYSRIEDDSAPYLVKGQCAQIVCQGQRVGVLGKVKPEVLKKFEVKQDVFVAEFDAAALLAAVPDALTYQAPPRFPATDRDITIVLDKKVEAEAVLAHVRKMDQEWIRALEIVAVYEGEPVPEGKKSLSFRITYRSDSTTLQDKEVNEVHERIGKELMEAFGAA
ncbi:phenylalanyl-tRNA synthetase beta subunit [Desulfatibacillum alkenivorans DSM 16219]|jgi:phenylalanyl-tRNA synthetase beta chain|uniref:Phenylalanine--tRNA ligase beta subunit n=1 Tax=Desulfatibacillum alkenivorans DSM 16219 TaxID=1121393 RepID=A0A1M6CKJ6_9BACT|nr:phenylalanine--tRNA ligase subunit beta [Desulfatibacillum alkenivorans]SHI61238.1 phenylalanyl-tRNA synthetase beta subunit [Desulfatibacillum alkenivorans DSM 16219]